MTYAKHVSIFFRQLVGFPSDEETRAARRARFHLASWECDELHRMWLEKKRAIEIEFSTDFSEVPTRPDLRAP